VIARTLLAPLSQFVMRQPWSVCFLTGCDCEIDTDVHGVTILTMSCSDSRSKYIIRFTRFTRRHAANVRYASDRLAIVAVFINCNIDTII